MSDDKLKLEIGVQVTSEGTDKAEKLRQEFALLNREILSSAKAIKDAFSALNSFSGRWRTAGSPATEEARAGRDALAVQGDLYAQLRKRWTFERRMNAQRKAEEADAARQIKQDQAETAQALQRQMQFSARIARQRAQAEAEAERETRREILETGRMRDRENRKALADAKAIQRAQQQAAQRVAAGAGQVRSGGTRAVVGAGAAGLAIGYGTKRALDALTRSGVSVDSALNQNIRLSGLSPKDAQAKGVEIRKKAMPIARSLGIKTSEYLKARAEAIQAGVEDELVDTVTEFGSKYARLNDLAPSEVMESSGYGITALGAFGKVTAEKVKQLFNLQQHLAATTAASRQGLNSFVRRGLSAGAAAGFSVEDTLAYGGAATSSGADGESAARMLSSTTERLASMPTRAAGIARKKHKSPKDMLILQLPRKLGFNSWTDLKKAFSVDSAGTVEKIYEGLAGITDPRARLEASEEIWGKEFGSVHAAMAVGHRFRAMRQSVRSRDAGRAIDQGMSIRSGSFDMIMDQIGSTIQDLKESLGLVLKPLWADLRDYALQAPVAFHAFEDAFRMGLRGFMQGLGSRDGTMAGLLRQWFGDPGAFKLNAYGIGDFARGFAQGLRDVGGAIVSFIRIFAGQNATPAEMGRWTARILGFSAALVVAAPAIAVLTGLAAAVAGFSRIVLSTWGLMKAAGLIGATGAGAAPKVPTGPGAGAAEGIMARLGRLLGIAAFAPTASLSKPDQDAMIKRLGDYAEQLEKDRQAQRGWADPPRRTKALENLQKPLEQLNESMELNAKIQKQSAEDQDFRSLIHPASLGNAARSIGDSIRNNAARAGGSALSGSVGNGPLIGSSAPGGSIGNGLTGMRRRGIMGGGSGVGAGVGSVGGSGVTNSRLAGDVAARAKIAHDFFRSKGLSEEATAGVLASMQRESNFTPNARGDGGRAHGLFQHHADRRAQILAGTGIDMSTASFEKQLEGAWWEMNHGDRGAQRALRILKTPGISARDAGGAFVQHFERPKRDERAERGALAEGFHRQFDNGSSGGSASVTPGQGGRSGGHIAGQINMEGKAYDFGSGGNRGANSIPSGVYLITPNTIGPWGRRNNAIGLNNNAILDDTLGRMRTGIEFHAASNARMLTSGCLGIAKDQYGAFRAHVLDMYKRHGQAFLTVDQNGAASITAERPIAKAKEAAKSFEPKLPPSVSGGSDNPAGAGLGAGDAATSAPTRTLGSDAPLSNRSQTGGAGASYGRTGHNINAPIQINGHNKDPQALAGEVQRHLQDSMNRRTHDYDGFA